LAGSRGLVVSALLMLLITQSAATQSLPVGSLLEDYLRILQMRGEADVGSFLVRPLSLGRLRLTAESHTWDARLGTARNLSTHGALAVAAPSLRTFVNTSFPVGGADGVVWQGRGVTTVLDGGAVVRVGALTVTARPAVIYTQNAGFDLAPVGLHDMPEYAYPWFRIDMPQRFGPTDFWTLDPGQSEVRFDAWGGSLGFGTSNLFWGPGVRNAIVMSQNAPGFPHAFLGTDGMLETVLGGFEARWVWGRLQQSDWFDPSSTSSKRFITGIALAYAPPYFEGLSLGLARVFYVSVPPSGTPVSDYLSVLQGIRKRTIATPENPTGDDAHDQILSLFARWVLAESRFEVYGEWARNDHSWEIRDFLLEPEHSQAYTVGLRQGFDAPGERFATLTAELTHLEASPTFQVRGKGTYYAHHLTTQGYTQRGQIIGAAVGPGGNSQHLGFDLYDPSGRLSIYLERQVHNNDAYYAWAAANNETTCCHHVSLHLGGHATRFVGDFDVGTGFIITREYNRYFFGPTLWNLNLSFSVRWQSGGSVP
jgi:hypothetical protein